MIDRERFKLQATLLEIGNDMSKPNESASTSRLQSVANKPAINIIWSAVMHALYCVLAIFELAKRKPLYQVIQNFVPLVLVSHQDNIIQHILFRS